jgi:hypothetical protein
MDKKIKRLRVILGENEEKCRTCGGLLFKGMLLFNEEELRPETIPDTVPCDVLPSLALKSDGVDYFFECPHCKAKNINLTIESYKEKPPKFEIVY